MGRPAGGGRCCRLRARRTCRTTSTCARGSRAPSCSSASWRRCSTHNRRWRADNERLAREAEALRANPAAIERSRATSSAGSARARSSSTCRASRGRGREQAGHKVKGRGISERAATTGSRHPRIAGVRRLRHRAVSAVVGWFPDIRAPGADLRRVAAATVLTGISAFKISARVRTARAPPDAAPRSRLRRRAGPLAADDGLPAARIFGGRRVGGVPAGVRGGQLPGDLPPAGRRAAAGGVGHRLRGGALLRPRGGARGGRRVSGHASFVAVFALLNVVFLHAEVARQRREHKQLVGRRGHGDAGGSARFPPDLDRAVTREPRADARRGAGEAVAGLDPDDPPAASTTSTCCARRWACRPARCCGSTRRASA